MVTKLEDSIFCWHKNARTNYSHGVYEGNMGGLPFANDFGIYDTDGQVSQHGVNIGRGV